MDSMVARSDHRARSDRSLRAAWAVIGPLLLLLLVACVQPGPTQLPRADQSVSVVVFNSSDRPVSFTLEFPDAPAAGGLAQIDECSSNVITFSGGSGELRLDVEGQPLYVRPMPPDGHVAITLDVEEDGTVSLGEPLLVTEAPAQPPQPDDCD